jgi:membrane metallo-endopeptidase-like protein 1
MADRLFSGSDTSSSKTRPKRTVIVLSVLLGIFILCTIILASLFTREKIIELKDDTCLTSYCIKAADYLINSIDQTVDPCEDFYQFTCGTWLKTVRIPDDASSEHRTRILERRMAENIADLLSTAPANETNPPLCVVNARILYNSCFNDTQIETDGIQPILSVLQTDFGGWPILQGPLWNNATFNISNLLLKLFQYNYNVVYGINTEIDDKNSSLRLIAINQGLLGLPGREYFQSETSITVAYRQFMRALAGTLINATSNDTSLLEQDITDMFEFEKNISQYYWTDDERRARDNETIRTTVPQLSLIFNTSFDFTNLLRTAYGSGNVTLNDTDTVTVSQLDFLNAVSSIINATSYRTLQNYFVWHFMMDQAGNMPRAFRVIKQEFDRYFEDTHDGPPRSVKCAFYVNNNMPFVVSKLYIKSYFNDSARNQTFEMIGNIRNSFVNMLDQSSWMDDASKGPAKDKARTMNQQIGYPDYIASDNTTRIEDDYADYRFGSNYIQNVFKIHQIQGTKNFLLLRQPVDHTAWGRLPPTSVYGLYQPSRNEIVIPAGALQMPFYDNDAPKYLNYGGIGTVIGHEITHGFDDVGRQFNKDGDRLPWWTQPTIDQFNIRKQCMINQYSNYTLPQIHMNNNGNQTQGEDIADNGGLKAAFFTYQQWAKANPNVDKKLPGLKKYSPEQLFFINFAHTYCIKMTDAYAYNHISNDPHSLGPFRVLGSTSNFDGFSKAFSCTTGQKNDPANKCAVW